LLQGLGEITVTNFEFLEQAHVLDCDDRLVGKGFEERNLLLRERTDFCTAERNHSDGDIFTQ
jgi:hypothetical protein